MPYESIPISLVLSDVIAKFDRTYPEPSWYASYPYPAQNAIGLLNRYLRKIQRHNTIVSEQGLEESYKTSADRVKINTIELLKLFFIDNGLLFSNLNYQNEGFCAFIESLFPEEKPLALHNNPDKIKEIIRLIQVREDIYSIVSKSIQDERKLRMVLFLFRLTNLDDKLCTFYYERCPYDYQLTDESYDKLHKNVKDFMRFAELFVPKDNILCSSGVISCNDDYIKRFFNDFGLGEIVLDFYNLYMLHERAVSRADEIADVEDRLEGLRGGIKRYGEYVMFSCGVQKALDQSQRMHLGEQCKLYFDNTNLAIHSSITQSMSRIHSLVDFDYTLPNVGVEFEAAERRLDAIGDRVPAAGPADIENDENNESDEDHDSERKMELAERLVMSFWRHDSVPTTTNETIELNELASSASPRGPH